MINDKNDNKVQLIGHYGSDQIHACSAWTSTSRDLNEDKINRIPKLLKMLADAGHHTPFEKSSLHFLIDTDIASHIHLIKHRVGTSVNGESARYKEIKEDKYLIPDDWKNIEVTNNLDINTKLNFMLAIDCIMPLLKILSLYWAASEQKNLLVISRHIILKFKLMLCSTGGHSIIS